MQNSLCFQEKIEISCWMWQKKENHTRERLVSEKLVKYHWCCQRSKRTTYWKERYWLSENFSDFLNVFTVLTVLFFFWSFLLQLNTKFVLRVFLFFFYIVFDYFVVVVVTGLSLWMPETHQNHAWHISDWRILTLNYNPLCVPPCHPSVSWLSFKPNTTEPPKKGHFSKSSMWLQEMSQTFPGPPEGLVMFSLDLCRIQTFILLHDPPLMACCASPLGGGTWWIIISWIPLHHGC